MHRFNGASPCSQYCGCIGEPECVCCLLYGRGLLCRAGEPDCVCCLLYGRGLLCRAGEPDCVCCLLYGRNYETLTVNITITWNRLSRIGRKKSVGPDCIPGEILKLGGEVMIPYLARLLYITMNNNAIPGDWKKAIVIPIYKGDRSVFGNYRPVSLTSLFCKQMEQVIAGYLRHVWEMSGLLYEGSACF